MEDDERLYRQLSDYLIAPHRDVIAEAFVTGKAVRVFVDEDGEIHMEAVQIHHP